MKKLSLYTLALLILSMILISCSGDSKKTEADHKLGRLEVEIPTSLKDNPEIVKYIHDMSRVADDYAIMIDSVLKELGSFEGKEMEELGMMDKIKLMKASAEVGFKSMDLMAKWVEYHEELNMYKDELTEEEILALESVLKRFEMRMEQIEQKHAKYFDNEY